MFDSRKYVLQVVFIVTGFVFLSKLFTIQILSKEYGDAAKNNVIMKSIEYPYRGLIYDRNNNFIVVNEPEYDLFIIPKNISIPDTLSFCNLLDISLEDFKNSAGTELEPSDWLLIDQARIDGFADATNDHQFIHCDPEKAAASPFGSTIAHGFLTLSLLSHLGSQGGALKLKDPVMGINYGLDKLRFINPVRAGKRIRARYTLIDGFEKKPRHYLLKHSVTVEIEGEEKPALIAETLGMTVI